MAVTVRSGPTFDPGVPVRLFDASANFYAVASDGRLLLELPAAAATSPPITLVLNWTTALKK
jgi:hypothetical protein